MTEKEFNTCVDSYANRLFRFIFKNIRRKEVAQDIVQNSFEMLWRHHQEVDVTKARAWLFTTAYRNMIDQIRRQTKMEYMEQLPDNRPTENDENFDLKRLLEMGLQRLNETQRSLLMLKDYEGYSYKEIGEIMDLSSQQVRVYLHRARLKMKAFLVKKEQLL